MTRFALAFAPLVPAALLWALAAAALVVVVLGLLGRRRGTLLRGLGLALLILALGDPSFVREDRHGEKDVVAVVLDRSGSQTIGERMGQTDRAKADLARELSALSNVEVRFIEAGQSEGDDGTRLFSALSNGLADVPPERVAGAIMVTDGQVHDIPPDAAALGFRAPLQVLVTGHAGERDRRVELIEAPRFGIVGKDQTISLRVLDTDDHGEPVDVTVRRDGVEVARRQAAVGARIDVPVRVDHAGPNVVEVDVPTIPGELTALNNKAVVTIDGVRDKLNVLLVSGEPHAGERMWRNILKSDANVDLVHFTILRPPEKQDGTPINELALIAFPTGELFGASINKFDLIIFDRYSNQSSILPYAYFENIARYVRNGGALLMAVGPDYAGPDGLYYTPLGAIAPVRPAGRVIETPFRARVTADGEKHPVTRGLAGSEADPPAWSLWFREVDGDAVRGTPVMSGAEGRPLVVLSREGKGRVAQMLSDQIWLWARGYQDGGPYLDLTRRLAHWLMKEPDLEEEALRATARGRDIAVERQSVKGITAPVTVTAPSGATVQVALSAAEPGLSRGTVKADELGLYRLADGTNSVLLNVGPENPREFQEVVSTPEKLRPLAEATGGSVRRIGTGNGDEIAMPRLVAMHEAPSYSGSDYIGIRRTDSSTVAGIGLLPLGVGAIGLLALLGSTVLAWVAEGWGARRKR